MKQSTLLLIVAVVVSGMLTGCATHAEKKQALAEQWKKTSAGGKLRTVENLIDRGRIADAEKTLAECLEAEPESAQAHFLMGRVHLIEQRNAEAKQSFTNAVALDAAHDAAWYHLAVLNDVEGSGDQALEAYQKALSLKPAEPEYLVGLSQYYMQSNRMEEARMLLQNGLKRQPGNRDLLLAMADLNQREGHLNKTASCYEQILLVNAQDREVLEALGYTYVALKDWQTATGTFEKLLSMIHTDAQKASMLETLGLCAFHAEQYELAMKYYDRLSVMRRDDPAVWLNMAQAALGANRLERAVVNARRALQLQPSWPEAYAALGSAQYLQKQYDAAIRSFSYARNDNEVGGYAWFMTGRCYAQLGQTARAEAAYKRAGDVAGNSPLIERFLNEANDSL